MLRVLLVLMPLVFAACTGDEPVAKAVSQPGHGSVKVVVEPNPIVAKPLANDLVGLPFDVVVTETGGLPVDVQKLVLNVTLAGASVFRLTVTADELQAAGHSTSIAASGSVRYQFHPKTRANEKLFSSASGEVTVVAVDKTATLALAATGVSLR